MNIMFQRVKIFKKPVLTLKYNGRQTLLSFLLRTKTVKNLVPKVFQAAMLDKRL